LASDNRLDVVFEDMHNVLSFFCSSCSLCQGWQCHCYKL